MRKRIKTGMVALYDTWTLSNMEYDLSVYNKRTGRTVEIPLLIDIWETLDGDQLIPGDVKVAMDELRYQAKL